jgi:hypothetical protein
LAVQVSLPRKVGVRMQTLYANIDFSAPEEETQRFPAVTPIVVYVVDRRVDATSEGFFTATVRSEEVRLNRLKRNRLVFGIFSLACAALLLICLYAGFPYEPAAAMTCCFTGMFAVFALKVKDAPR